MLNGRIVQYYAAAYRFQRRIEADNKSVAVFRCYRLRHPQLRIAAFARLQRVPLKQHHLGQHYGRAVVKMNLHIVCYNAAGVFKVHQLNVQHS